MADLTLFEGEAKTVTATYANELNVSSATLTFAMKEHAYDAVALVTVNHASFGMANAATGVVTFPLSSVDTDRVGTFIGQIKTQFSAANIDKSVYFEIEIGEAVV